MDPSQGMDQNLYHPVGWTQRADGGSPRGMPVVNLNAKTLYLRVVNRLRVQAFGRQGFRVRAVGRFRGHPEGWAHFGSIPRDGPKFGLGFTLFGRFRETQGHPGSPQ